MAIDLYLRRLEGQGQILELSTMCNNVRVWSAVCMCVSVCLYCLDTGVHEGEGSATGWRGGAVWLLRNTDNKVLQFEDGCHLKPSLPTLWEYCDWNHQLSSATLGSKILAPFSESSALLSVLLPFPWCQ